MKFNFFEKLGKESDFEKQVAEVKAKYEELKPGFADYKKFNKGEIPMEMLSNDALARVYQEKKEQYDIEVDNYNMVRQATTDDFVRTKEIDDQDDRTAEARQELNKATKEIRRRGLPEN